MPQQTDEPQTDQPQKKLAFLGKIRDTKLVRWLGGTYPGKLVAGMFGDHVFCTRANGMAAGGIVIAEAYLVAGHVLPWLLKFTGLAAVPVVPVVAHALVFGGIVGIGACAIGYGAVNVWKSLEGICDKINPNFNPLRSTRKFVQTVIKAISATPPVQMLSNGIKNVAGRIAQKPLAQKFLNTGLGRLMSRGLTQNQQDALLAGVTLEGCMAWGIGFPTAITVYVATLPAIATVGGISALAGIVGIALWQMADCAWNMRNSIKTLGHIRREHKEAKSSGATIAPPVQETAAQPVFTNVKPAFNGGKVGQQVYAPAPLTASPPPPA